MEEASGGSCRSVGKASRGEERYPVGEIKEKVADAPNEKPEA